MIHTAKSIRPFIGSKDYNLSRNFYTTLGFEESVISYHLSFFKIFDSSGFYLQDAYVEDWINNTMVFIEVEDVNLYYDALKQLQLHKKYPNVRLVPVKINDWGSECFLHDPAGILWHFGTFKK
jgi:hypothetical protein